MKKYFFLIVSLIFAGVYSKPSAFAGETGAAFLNMDVGARSAAMGSAFTAMAEDASAVYWNPSGTASIRKPQAFLMHSQWLSGMHHEFASYVHPTKKGAMGIGVSFLAQGNFEGRNEDRTPARDFSASDVASFFSLSRAVLGASLGVNLKLIQQNLESEKAMGFAFDLGGRFQKAGSALSLGATLQNIGPKMKFLDQKYDLPLTASGGAAYKLWDRLSISADFRQGVRTQNTNLSIGAEYWAFNTLAFRTGYLSPIGGTSNSKSNLGGNSDLQIGNLSRLGGGIGLKLFSYQLDYALVPYGELGNVHKISLIASF